MSGLVIFAPPFMNRRLSVQFKGGLVFFLSLAIYPTVENAKVVFTLRFPNHRHCRPGGNMDWLFDWFSVQLMFMTFQLAGEFVDKHIGFAMASLLTLKPMLLYRSWAHYL